MDNSAEEITFGLIAYSGQARSAAYDALEKAKAGIFDEAAELMKTAEEAQLQAHNIQTELLTKEAQGKHTAVDVLLVHAQDHLMTSILAVELIQQIIELYQRLAEK
jgi:cellobiose PTS system EIIA component